MACPSTEELAGIYDGTLPKTLSQRVRDHVAFCPRCSHEFNLLHQTLQNQHAAPTPPKDLLEQAMLNRPAKEFPTSHRVSTRLQRQRKRIGFGRK